jgi:hypothetical protein
MPQNAEPVCWICRTNKGTTREHLVKKSDLKALFENDGRHGPYFYSDAQRLNQIVQGLKSNTLKSPVLICADCNGARTQPHDFAWEWMSNWLRRNPRLLRLGQVIRPNRIFPYNTHKQMLKVHLYFLKLFGGLIKEGAGNIPIDMTLLKWAAVTFANAPRVLPLSFFLSCINEASSRSGWRWWRSGSRRKGFRSIGRASVIWFTPLEIKLR